MCARARACEHMPFAAAGQRGSQGRGGSAAPDRSWWTRRRGPPRAEEHGTQVGAANQGAGRSKVSKPSISSISMQAGVSPNGRHNVQIRLSLPPLGQGDSSRRPEGNRSRRQHVFRVTYCTVLAEWSTAFIAVGLLSFYLFAILDTKEQGQRDNINYKVGGSAPGSAPRRLHAPLASCPCTQRC